MNPGADQRLKQLFAAAPEDAQANGFATAVERRIGRVRRARLVARMLAVVVLIVIALALSPAAVMTASYITESSAELTGVLGKAIMSPAAFAVGILISLYALFEVHYR
jgi:hypothetical protein